MPHRTCRAALSLMITVTMLDFALSAPASGADAGPIPVREFFRHPERGFFRISPDGKTLAFMQPWNRRMNIHVQPITGGEPRRLTDETTRDISDHFWKGPTRLVYLKDFGGDE